MQTEAPGIYDENGISYYLEADGTLWAANIGTCTLKNITIPSKVGDRAVTGVYEGAFSTDIESVTLSEGITTIQRAAFLNCANLKTVVLPSTLLHIGEYAFLTCPIENINFPEGLLTIGRQAFPQVQCKKLVIPASVTSIGVNAFRKSAIEELTILTTATLESGVFKECKNLKTVHLADGITQLTASLFKDCSALTTINIPESVTVFGGNVFSGCSNLRIQQLTLRGSVGIGANAFKSVKITNLDVYKNISGYAFGYAGIQNLTIHEGVTYIDKHAFEYAGIANLDIPSSLTEVKASAFYGCGIDTVVFKSPVFLGHSAFKNSTIQSITLPVGSKLDWYVFSGCKHLETIHYGGTLAQFRLLTEGEKSINLSNTTVICSDGTIAPQSV